MSGIFFKPARCGYTLRVTSHKHLIHLNTLHQHSRISDYYITLITRLSFEISHSRPDRVAQLAERWDSIPKVVGSIPTVARHIFQACPVWIYTQSDITQATTRYSKRIDYSVSFDADQSIRSRIAFTCCEHFILQRFPISQVMKICKVPGP